MRINFLLFNLLLILINFSSQAQVGPLDMTFGNGGKVTTSFSNNGDQAGVNAIAIQSDGQIVAVGSTGFDIAVSRYNTDGSLDINFGMGGKVTTRIFKFGSYVGLLELSKAYAVAIQSDGKIVVAGYQNSDSHYFLVVRYNADGSLDNSFSSDGIVLTTFGGSVPCYNIASSIVIQSDGKILLGGYTGTYVTGGSDFALARYNSNGSLDTSFGIGGMLVISNFPTFSTYADIRSMVVQSDGKILINGLTSTNVGYDFALMRLNGNGNVDSTFGINGMVFTDFGTGYNRLESMAIQPDGKIIAGGFIMGDQYSSSTSDFALARFTSDGALDTTFGTGGKVTADLGYSYEFFSKLSLQNDGKIVMAGSVLNCANGDFVVLRFNSNGALDNSFCSGGKLTTDFAGNNDGASSVVIQSDGKIIVGGSSGQSSVSDFALVRYDIANITCAPIIGSQNVTICYGDSLKNCKRVYKVNGTYSDTLSATNGCDSILTTYLTVLPANTYTQTITICGGQNITIGSKTHDTSAVYVDTLASYQGCDSIISTNLTVLPVSTFTQILTLCGGQGTTVGTNTYKASDVYVDTLVSYQGCDSIITTDLTILSTVLYSTSYDSIQNTFNLAVDSATTAFAVSYFWDFGDGTSSILATPFHTYTVDSLYNVCMKTYDALGDSCTYCHIIGKDSVGNIVRSAGFSIKVKNANSATGISLANSEEQIISIFPNPFTSQTSIMFSKEMQNATIRIIDILGKEINSINFTGKELVIDKGMMKEGIYFVHIFEKNRIVTNRKIIIR